MKIIRFALLALLLPIAAGAATISGTVTSDTGAPLPSMTVSAYTTAGALQATGTTSSSGTYSLTVPAGTYQVLAYDPAGAFATSFYADAESFETSALLTVTATQTLTNINFRLVHAGFAVGHVTSTSGAPLANITVAAYNPDGTTRGFTKTDSAGSFTLALPPGTYRLGAFDESLGHATTFFTSALSFDAASPVTIVATQSFTANIQLPPAAAIRGTVTDRATLAPLGGMRAIAYYANGTIAGTALTDGSGHYAFAVRPGSIRVVIADPHGSYATAYVPDAESFTAEPAIDALAGQSYTANASLVRGGRVAGRVTSATNGSAVTSVIVAAYNSDGTIRAFVPSDSNGIFSLLLPPGDYRLGVFDQALAWLPQFYALQPSFNSAAIVHVTAQQTASGYDFSLTRAAHVAGHVTTGNLAVSNAVVAAYDLSGRIISSATTDVNGAYSLYLTPATIKLLAFDPQFRYATTYYSGAPSFTASPSLNLAEGSSLTADFSMAAAGTATGSVVDAASSAPLASIQVLAYDANFNVVAETATDSSGAFRLALAAGTYTVAAADPQGRYAGAAYASPVTIHANSTTGSIRIALSTPTAPASVRHRAVRH
jgi:hypothetical protein